MQKYLCVAGFCLLTLVLVSCSGFEKIRKSPDLQKKVKAAFTYYEKEKYAKADILFEEVLPLIQGAPEAEKGNFYHAYTKFYLGDYILSKYQFQKFYETYARSQYAEESMYMYAVSLYEDSPPFNLDQTSTLEAIGAMQNFINTYPTSKYAEQATARIEELRIKVERKAYEAAMLYAKISNHKAALMAFSNFQRSHPDSDYNEEISFRKVESAYLLAKQSITTKQTERYKEAITYYETFLDKYPQSKYIRQAEGYYEKSLNQVGNASKNAQAQQTQKIN